MTLLKIAKRCGLFEEIASNAWQRIIYNHSVNTEVNEPGMTNNIVAEIRHNALAWPNIGVWANNGYREIDHGSDIDVFVEITAGHFVWWALQAKVLRFNGRYKDVATKRGGEYQWDKLNRLSAKAGCESRYLFYNGVKNYSTIGSDHCNAIAAPEQYGCSLVNTDIVKATATRGQPKFSDFHPIHAQPWRIITCCLYKSNDTTRFYSIAQIKNAVRLYRDQPDNKNILLPETDQSLPEEEVSAESKLTMEFKTNIFKEDATKNEKEPLSIDAITTFSNSIERYPYYRIVIRATNALPK